MPPFSPFIFGLKMEKVLKLLPFRTRCVIITTVTKMTECFLFQRKDELMREAKTVATVFGAISVCLIGGLGVAFNAAPQVRSSNVEIEEPASEEAIAATKTSVSTTIAIVTTTPGTKRNALTTTSAKAETETSTLGSDEEDGSLWSVNYADHYDSAPQYNASAEYVYDPASDTVTTTTVPAYTTVTVPETTTTTTTFATTTTTTTTTFTTTTTTTTSAATTTTTTTAAPETTTAVTTTAPAVQANTSSLPISDSDFMVLCNVVGHEAGSSWISTYDKAKVVEVIMNRVYSPLFPNSISAVLTQPYQFTGAQSYAFNGTYNWYVTESVKEAVRLYFSDPSQFSHGYLYFWGDGYQNHFH